MQNILRIQKNLINQDLRGMDQHLTHLYHLEVAHECVQEMNLHECMARPLMRRTLLLLGLLLCITGIRTVEVDDEEKFTYIKGDVRGPEHWGDLVDGWEICGNGRLQSPIALVKSQALISPELDELRRIYYPAKAILENRGHDIRVRWPTGGGSIVIDGKSYTLNECRWHHPSEHSVDGKIYPLEIQMEHQAKDYSSAIVSMLYSYGKPNTFLTKVTEKLPSIDDKEPPKEALGMVDPNEITMSGKEYYRYNGSRTVPICREGITWTIFEKISTVSEQQVKALQAAIHDEYKLNARPIQPKNRRIVKLYAP